ncbi:membrane protein [Mesorhizobium sp. L-8-10]|uniref:glycosyltransferase family protein n=1 Tax=Mesorhizobium sp. L-8-10 TaxID=2744523 RepID=UPI00192567EA|nr:glycosyltransferase [Mesorhizobium sp. L-8-10]BCH29272.1 membrane protein [Mesorhizobium sp. L-8-10]
MYSHDTFGLGHLRRSRTIAHALVDHFPEMEVSIISGSPVVDAFWFHERVNYIQIPAAQKLSNGEYSSGSSSHSLEDTLAARESIIRAAAERLRPDMVIVDKEPLGLGREMLRTLRWLKALGTIAVLGLRDVLDAPELLQGEWERKQNTAFTEEIYDEIWIYGPGSFYNPLSSIELDEATQAQTRYTGFLARSLPPMDDGTAGRYGTGYILVTAGGGGDGYELMAAALKAVKRRPDSTDRYLFVLGPFMTEQQRFEITARASSLANVEVVDFHVNVETLVANAAAIVGMCGYNTFCEVMSFDKRALFVPRTAPRREQSIRAHRAAEFGWVDVLDIEEAKDPSKFMAAIDRLERNPLPSGAVARPDLDGLSRVCALTEILFEQRDERMAVDDLPEAAGQ